MKKQIILLLIILLLQPINTISKYATAIHFYISSFRALVDYTPGYGNKVMGVASASIGKINGVATANIAKVDGVA